MKQRLGLLTVLVFAACGSSKLPSSNGIITLPLLADGAVEVLPNACSMGGGEYCPEGSMCSFGQCTIDDGGLGVLHCDCDPVDGGDAVWNACECVEVGTKTPVMQPWDGAIP